jgi:hypothetical protein
MATPKQEILDFWVGKNPAVKSLISALDMVMVKDPANKRVHDLIHGKKVVVTDHLGNTINCTIDEERTVLACPERPYWIDANLGKIYLAHKTDWKFQPLKKEEDGERTRTKINESVE